MVGFHIFIILPMSKEVNKRKKNGLDFASRPLFIYLTKKGDFKMSKQFDSGIQILYNQELEQLIERAVEKAVSHVLSALMNLDNGTDVHDPPLCVKPTLTVDEAARLIGISKPKMYELTKSPDFPVIHIGRKILINRQSLLRWMKGETNHGEKTR